MWVNYQAGAERKLFKWPLCYSSCPSPRGAPKICSLAPWMSFHSLSGDCWYLFPSSVPNNQMHFPERPQLACQGPGKNIKITWERNLLGIIFSFLLGIFICSELSLFPFSCLSWPFSWLFFSLYKAPQGISSVSVIMNEVDSKRFLLDFFD